MVAKHSAPGRDAPKAMAALSKNQNPVLVSSSVKSTAQHSTAQHSTAQHSTAHYSTPNPAVSNPKSSSPTPSTTAFTARTLATKPLPGSRPTSSTASATHPASATKLAVSHQAANAASAASPGKRGLAYNDAGLGASFGAGNTSWAYNWGTEPTIDTSTTLVNVPVISSQDKKPTDPAQALFDQGAKTQAADAASAAAAANDNSYALAA
jgi:hypothetical protein